MFSKIKKMAGFASQKPKIIDFSALQTNLTDGLMSTLEKSILSQKSDAENSNYTPEDVEKIINGYAKKNMMLAAASSVVPGPLGILGSLPELFVNFGNQMGMIYDLGCAHGKEDFINKDLLLDIPFAVFGGNTNLAALQNNKNLLDSPIESLQTKAVELSGALMEKTMKKSIIQFIPVAGPVLMGIWSKMTTSKMASFSNQFFDQSTNYTEHFKNPETDQIKTEIQIQKIKGLANLIEANNEINESQIAFIKPIIANANIDLAQKEFLLEESIKAGSNFQLDFGLLQDYEEDEALILEMIILAKRSGHIDSHEKEYIYKVANNLGLNEKYVDDLME